MLPNRTPGDRMSVIFEREKNVTASAKILPVHFLRPQMWERHKQTLTPPQKKFAAQSQFDAKLGKLLRLPDEEGNIACILFGVGEENGIESGPILTGKLSRILESGFYKMGTLPDDWHGILAQIGWGLGAYKYDNYLQDNYEPPILVIEDDTRIGETRSLVDAIHFGRDLINMPAGDLGPVALHKAAEDLAKQYNAQCRATVGDELLHKNFPMIHAVGAHALALSKMIMANNLPVQLHCLISIAENAISAGSYRPGDVLSSRAGLTVEIDNTDAEGRLVMADALTRAAEEKPVLIMDFATLTGAARVALGPTLPPFFSNRQKPVEGVLHQTDRQNDPVWHMPLWQPYNKMLDSPIADMKNAGGSFAGSITAALFLERFTHDCPWMHFDVYGWNPTARPGHPKGGEMFAIRAIYHWLKSGGLNGDFSA